MKFLMSVVGIAGPLLLHFAIMRESDRLLHAFFGLVAAGFVMVAIERRQWLRYFALAALTVLAALGVDAALLRAVAPLWAAFIYVALAWLFGRTLRAGSQPLIERFARIEHGEGIARELVAYARSLTWVWTGLFVVFALVTIVLANHARTETLSLFTNIISWVLMVLLYVFEFVYRRFAFRHLAHANPFRVAVNIARNAPRLMR